MKKSAWKSIALIGALWATAVPAAVDTTTGHIVDIAFGGLHLGSEGVVMRIKMDSALPDNCAGTTDDWIMVGGSEWALRFIYDVWMSGAAAQKLITIRTVPTTTSGPPSMPLPGPYYCTLKELHPDN